MKIEKTLKFDYPRNMLRVVLQVKDTPENQAAMQKVLDAIRSVGIPDITHAVLKAEQINMLVGCVTKAPEANPKL